MNLTLKRAWLALTVFAAFSPFLPGYTNMVACLILLLLSLPLGVIVTWVSGGCFVLLRRLGWTPETDQAWTFLNVAWMLLLGWAGYMQWFVLLPWARKALGYKQV